MKLREKLGILFVSLFMIIGFLYLLCTNQLKTIILSIGQTNKIWFGCAVISIFFYWIMESKILQLAMPFNKISDYHAFRLSMIGQFFSGLTPFASGGQPAQILTLKKLKVNMSTSSSALLSKFIVYQTTLVVYTCILLLFKSNAIYQYLNGKMAFIYLGFTVNLVVIIALIFIAFAKRFNIIVLNQLICCLGKIKLIKQVRETQIKSEQFIHDFHHEIRKLLKSPIKLLKMMCMTLMQLTFFFLTPFYIYKAFALHGYTVIDIVAGSAFVLLLTSFVPLPGGSGGAEGGFYLIFGMFFLPSNLIPALIIWRLITYYLWMFIGGSMVLIHNRLGSEI